MYFSYLIYISYLLRRKKVRYLALVIHGAVILLAEILGNLCYYEMKLLHCILYRINQTYNSIVLIWKKRPKVKCSSYEKFQLLGVPAISRIFYLFKRSEAIESANVTNVVPSILVSLERPYRYLENVELENCRTYNFRKFYVQFLLSFVYPYILKSQTFLRCHTNKSRPKNTSLALFDRFCIQRLCITGKLSDVHVGFNLICILLARGFIET